jgi:response regulator NasT
VAEASDGETAVNLARSVRPAVALMDIKMPGEMDGLDAAKVIIEEEICPVVLLTAYNQQELVEEASTVGVYGYLVKPIKENEVFPAINVAIAKWAYLKKLKEENASLKDQLENRKIIDIAKGILMEKYNLKEKEAYRRMQKLSMNDRKGMAEIAKSIIVSNRLMESS